MNDWIKSGVQQGKKTLFSIFQLRKRAPKLFFLFTQFLLFYSLLFSSDSGSCGQRMPAFGTSETGTAVAASVAAGSLEVPTWGWTSSS